MLYMQALPCSVQCPAKVVHKTKSLIDFAVSHHIAILKCFSNSHVQGLICSRAISGIGLDGLDRMEISIGTDSMIILC